MKFFVAPVSDSRTVYKVWCADMKPKKDLGLLIEAFRNLNRCAEKDFLVTSNFNQKKRPRNPGVYAAPIFKSPEVSK